MILEIEACMTVWNSEQRSIRWIQYTEWYLVAASLVWCISRKAYHAVGRMRAINPDYHQVKSTHQLDRGNVRSIKSRHATPASKSLQVRVSNFCHVAFKVYLNSPSTVDIQIDTSNEFSFITA